MTEYRSVIIPSQPLSQTLARSLMKRPFRDPILAQSSGQRPRVVNGDRALMRQDSVFSQPDHPGSRFLQEGGASHFRIRLRERSL